MFLLPVLKLISLPWLGSSLHMFLGSSNVDMVHQYDLINASRPSFVRTAVHRKTSKQSYTVVNLMTRLSLGVRSWLVLVVQAP